MRTHEQCKNDTDIALARRRRAQYEHGSALDTTAADARCEPAYAHTHAGARTHRNAPAVSATHPRKSLRSRLSSSTRAAMATLPAAQRNAKRSPHTCPPPPPHARTHERSACARRHGHARGLSCCARLWTRQQDRRPQTGARSGHCATTRRARVRHSNQAGRHTPCSDEATMQQPTSLVHSNLPEKKRTHDAEPIGTQTRRWHVQCTTVAAVQQTKTSTSNSFAASASAAATVAASGATTATCTGASLPLTASGL